MRHHCGDHSQGHLGMQVINRQRNNGLSHNCFRTLFGKYNFSEKNPEEAKVRDTIAMFEKGREIFDDDELAEIADMGARERDAELVLLRRSRQDGDYGKK